MREAEGVVLVTTHSNPLGYVGDFAETNTVAYGLSRSQRRTIVIGDILVSVSFGVHIQTLSQDKVWKEILTSLATVGAIRVFVKGELMRLDSEKMIKAPLYTTIKIRRVPPYVLFKQIEELLES